MARYAIIENNIVTNVVVWDGNGDLFSADKIVALPDGSPVSVDFTTTDAGVTFTAPIPAPLPDYGNT